MTDTAQLLLPNGSELELNLVRIAPRVQMDTLSDAPSNTMSAIPASFAPWLIAEWSLARFTPYFSTSQELIDNGRPWLLERGSAASILRGLAWLGYDQISIEEDEFLIHIDPGTNAAALDLERIRHVVNASLPAHSRFYRLYHGLDLRAGRLDSTSFDQCLYDDDSGIWFDDPNTNGVKLSFGELHVAIVNTPPSITPLAAHRPRQLNVVVDDSLMQLDSWVLDSEIRLNSVVSISDLTTGMVDQPAQDDPLQCHQSTYCVELAAYDIGTPIRTISPDVTAEVLPRALPIYGWSDQWNKGWVVHYPLIAIPPGVN